MLVGDFFPSNWLKVKVMLRPTVSWLIYHGVMTPSGAQDQIFITVKWLRICWCGVLSLTRGYVCRLQLLLALANAAILRPESHVTHDHILLSQIWDSITWRATSPYLYPPGTEWPSYTPRHWILFSWPPTAHRAMVVVFKPASMQGNWLKITG
jgi:hypothetical protein